MGCDIHAAIEYKENGVWKAVLRPNPWAGRWEGEKELTAKVDIHRDYDLFAILANVQNGRGFAGVQTGEGFNYISEPRGLPEDVTKETLSVLSDEHSSTFVTLEEILRFDWTQVTTHYGYVHLAEYFSWKQHKEYNPWPNSWCGDVSGVNVVKVSNEQGDLMLKESGEDSSGRKNQEEFIAKLFPNTYTRISWQTSYADAAKQIWLRILPEMLKYGSMVGWENVRLVMDFDS